MSGSSLRQYGTYRCPVCGYRDEVEFRQDGQTPTTCTNCETLLTLWPRSHDSVRLRTQIAEGCSPT